MMRLPHRAAALAAPLLLAACASNLEDIGEPPAMTAPGAPRTAVEPLSQSRAALTRRPPPPVPEPYEAASLWRSGPKSLFGDRRARTIGDIMTVVIEIDESAELSNESNRSRSGTENVDLPILPELMGLTDLVTDLIYGNQTSPAVGFTTGGQSSGSGSISREEEVTLRLAATVTDVLPNGHLVIFGSQELRVNHELRDLQVAGIVRPEDISRRNDISYDKIADARIAYGGRGTISAVQQPRYGQQILDGVLPF